MKKWIKETGADFFFGPVETKGIFMDLPGLEIKLPENDQGSLKNTYFQSIDEAVEKYLYDPFDPATCPQFYRYVVDFFASQRKACQDVMMPVWCEGVLTTSGFLFGMENLIMGLMMQPEEINRVIDRGAAFSRDIVSAQLEEVYADYVVYTDPVSSADMIDGDMFRKFNRDRLHDNIMHWNREYGVDTMLHICGDTTPMLPDFVKTGAKVMSLDHKVDLRDARKCFGDKVAIMGNLDPVSVMLSDSVEKVTEEAERCFSYAGQDGGYIFGAGCAEPLNTPIRNIQAMVEVSKRHPYR
jgi:MtaA/CmuA family methyltransferase